MFYTTLASWLTCLHKTTMCGTSRHQVFSSHVQSSTAIILHVVLVELPEVYIDRCYRESVLYLAVKTFATVGTCYKLERAAHYIRY